LILKACYKKCQPQLLHEITEAPPLYTSIFIKKLKKQRKPKKTLLPVKKKKKVEPKVKPFCEPRKFEDFFFNET